MNGKCRGDRGILPQGQRMPQETVKEYVSGDSEGECLSQQ